MTPAELAKIQGKLPLSASTLSRNLPDGLGAVSPLAPSGQDVKMPIANIGQSMDEQKLNKLERSYLQHLRTCGFGWIGIQCITLKLAHDCRYTCDFWTVGLPGVEGQLVAREVKGPHAWEDGIIKLKVAARLYPFIVFVIVRREKDFGWKTEIIHP